MPQFAKLFNVKQGTEQVIMQKAGYNDDDECYQIKLTTQVDVDEAIVTAEITLSYEDEDTYNEQFDKYDQKGAETFRQSMETSLLS